MKIAVMVIGILGALASFSLGAKWISDYSEYSDTITSLEKMSEKTGTASAELQKLKGLRNSGWSLMVLSVLSLAASVMISKLGGKITGGVLLLAVIVPAVFSAKSLIATFILAIAAILAFLYKPKETAPGA